MIITCCEKTIEQADPFDSNPRSRIWSGPSRFTRARWWFPKKIHSTPILWLSKMPWIFPIPRLKHASTNAGGRLILAPSYESIERKIPSSYISLSSSERIHLLNYLKLCLHLTQHFFVGNSTVQYICHMFSIGIASSYRRGAPQEVASNIFLLGEYRDIPGTCER